MAHPNLFGELDDRDIPFFGSNTEKLKRVGVGVLLDQNGSVVVNPVIVRNFSNNNQIIDDFVAVAGTNPDRIMHRCPHCCFGTGQVQMLHSH